MTITSFFYIIYTFLSASDCRLKGQKFESQLGLITFMEIDHEIISTIVFLPLIQEGQLLVTGASVHKYWLIT